MLIEIFSEQPTFRNIRFKEKGLNVLLAERTAESGEKQSRNGLGKSTLNEVLHFCLGADANRSILNTGDLQDWTFGLRLRLYNRAELEVERSLREAKTVTYREWGIGGSQRHAKCAVSLWNKLLGESLFGLADTEANVGFRPLFAYFARRGGDSYLQPFDLVRKQKAGKAAVLVAFLLGLNWQDVQSMESIQSEQKRLSDEKKTLKLSEGKLTAMRIQVERQLTQESAALKDFRVHPQYAEIEARASQLTRTIQALSEDCIMERQKLDHYKRAVVDEVQSDPMDVAAIFAEAQVVFSAEVTRTLDEARSFHQQVIQNRKQYLAREIRLHEQSLRTKEEEKRSLINDRAELMEVLSSHGALQEYEQLRQRTGKYFDELAVINHQLKQLKSLEEKSLGLQRRKMDCQERIRQNFQEAVPLRDMAVAKFSEYAERLYDGGGVLVLELGNEAQFHFDAWFQNNHSQSVGAMKVFCFDLVLATLWAQQGRGPGFLFHDSMIFDGVDERQKAKAIELAAEVSQANGFQYICTMNTDQVPYKEFSSNFSFADSVVATLQDSGPEGKLLGIQFETKEKIQIPLPIPQTQAQSMVTTLG